MRFLFAGKVVGDEGDDAAAGAWLEGTSNRGHYHQNWRQPWFTYKRRVGTRIGSVLLQMQQNSASTIGDSKSEPNADTP